MQTTPFSRRIILRFTALMLLVALTAAPIYTAVVAAADDAPVDYYEQYQKYRDQNVFLALAFAMGAIAQGAHPVFSLASVSELIVSLDRYRISEGGLSTQIVVNENDKMDLGATVENVFSNALSGKSLFLGEALRSAYDATKTAGLVLMTIYLLLAILTDVQQETMNYEQLFKKLLGFAIAVLVVVNGFAIFRGVLSVSEALLRDVNAALAKTQTDATGLSAICNELDAIWESKPAALGVIMQIIGTLSIMMQAIGTFIQNIPFALTMIVAICIIYFVSFGRAIELVIRFLFAPIGCASLVNGGMNSSGMRYVKKFASVGIQGAVILASVRGGEVIRASLMSFTHLANNVRGTILGPLINILIVIAICGLCVKANRISDEIVGV